MSIFGDIGSAIGDAVSGITGVANSIVSSTVGQTLLTGVGMAIGDPALASEASGALKTATAFEKMFGMGPSPTPSPRPGGLRLQPAGQSVLTRSLASPAGPTRRYPLTLRGRRFMLTKSQFNSVARWYITHRHTNTLASPPPVPPPVVIPPPPPPPPVIAATPAIVRAVLADPDAVAAAVASGAPLLIGGKLIDPGQPIVLPPVMASLAADMSAGTGLTVIVPDDNTDARNGGSSNRSTDL